MKYTSSFTVTDAGVTIRRATANEAAGDGVIPASFNALEITLLPVPDEGDPYPTYYVKGSHPESEWVEIQPATPGFTETDLSNVQSMFQVKAATGESFTMNMFVRGR